MWAMILSEISSAICLMYGESNCGTSDCLSLARFRVRTLICSPPLLGGLGSDRQVSLLLCM